MQIIKLITKDTAPFIDKINGTLAYLSTDNDNLLNYPIPDSKEDFFYIIETSPDTSNPLNYDGVAIALKIYFQAIVNNISKFRILLIGFENEVSFFQFCTYSNILKCPGIDYLQIENDIEKNIKKELPTIQLKHAEQSILNIGINPPTSYKTHHSIANEWAVLRWAKALKIEDNKLLETKMKVDNDLYYNYLKTIYPIKDDVTTTNRVLLQNGKILLIDDEVEKGWGLIFNKICAAKLQHFGNEFKNWPTDKIITESVEKAKEADVVILDLRLHDDDFEQKESRKLTGFQILEKIKTHNKGIQVIVFSATNKIWNLQALQEAGADGFIIKEAPEMSVDANFTAKSIDNIYKTIDNCLSMKFLKNIYFDTSLLKNVFLNEKKMILILLKS